MIDRLGIWDHSLGKLRAVGSFVIDLQLHPCWLEIHQNVIQKILEHASQIRHFSLGKAL